MSKTSVLSLVAVAALAASAAARAADPSPHQIYEAVQSGQLALAQSMVGQVLKDHPQNARAHYIAAEVDARIGDLNAARQQLAQARALDPQLSFASAHSQGELNAQLAGRTLAPGVMPRAFAQPHRASVPWALLLVLGAGALLLFSLFRRRAQPAAYYAPQPTQPYGGAPAGGPGLQGGYGYGAPYPPPAGGMGSGIMGGLATGLAVGAGVAAGEALVDRMIDGHGTGAGGYAPPDNYAAADLSDPGANQDLGGNDFGVSDGSDWGGDASGGGDFLGGGGDDWT